MKSRACLTVLLGIVLGFAPAHATELAWHFLAPGAVDLKAVLPAPPAAGSPGALGDLEAVLQMQAARSPNDIAWAKFIERDNAFNNSQVLGAWFAKDKLPATAELLREVTEDMVLAGKGAKDLYPRPRPFRTDPAVHPCVDRPDSGSYPSGHSQQAFVWAEVLSDIFPEHRAELLARAHQAAWGRVIGGVHFPSDLVGGRIVAEAIIDALRKNPAYRTAIEKCRAEAAPYLTKKAA